MGHLDDVKDELVGLFKSLSQTLIADTKAFLQSEIVKVVPKLPDYSNLSDQQIKDAVIHAVIKAVDELTLPFVENQPALAAVREQLHAALTSLL